MKIVAGFDISKDELGYEYHYYVPFHNDRGIIGLDYKVKHGKPINPYFILFVKDITSKVSLIHKFNNSFVKYDIEPNNTYVFNGYEDHALLPTNIANTYMKLLKAKTKCEKHKLAARFKKFYTRLKTDFYGDKTVDYILKCKIIDFQHGNNVKMIIINN